MNKEFWTLVDRLTETASIVIDRPRGSAHPRYPHVIYPLDYGYLENTSAMDNSGIDVWIGSLNHQRATALICTVDLIKRDSEVKILLGCTEEEQHLIITFHNNSSYMKGILISREETIC